MHSEYEHGDLRVGGEDGRGGDFTAVAGQVQVHQHNVRPRSLCDVDGFLCGRRFPDDLDVLDPAEEGTKALPEDHVVIDDYQADRRHGSTGIRA
jgi:hypothetical protein